MTYGRLYLLGNFFELQVITLNVIKSTYSLCTSTKLKKKNFAQIQVKLHPNNKEHILFAIIFNLVAYVK